MTGKEWNKLKAWLEKRPKEKREKAIPLDRYEIIDFIIKKYSHQDPQIRGTSRIIYHLFFWESMRQKDIAEILCVSRPNVSKCLKKHMARLTSSKTNYRVQWNMERLTTYGYMKKKKSTIKIIKRSKNGKEEIIEKQK